MACKHCKHEKYDEGYFEQVFTVFGFILYCAWWIYSGDYFFALFMTVFTYIPIAIICSPILFIIIFALDTKDWHTT